MGCGPGIASKTSVRRKRLRENPALVWDFYSKRRADCAKAEPNPAHKALAELESKLGERFFLCTQNVDDLHERAGSRCLVHMHGELAKSRCSEECGAPPVEDHTVYASLDEVGRCICGARLRPHIVFFGEMPLEMNRIQQELNRSTLMAVIGTSGSVYPAANFVHWARQAGAKTIYIGPERPLNCGSLHNNRRRQSRRGASGIVCCGVGCELQSKTRHLLSDETFLLL